MNSPANATSIKNFSDISISSPAVSTNSEGQSENFWSPTHLCGRLTQIDSYGPSASLSLLAGLVAEVQQNGDPLAWVTTQSSYFYPPDFDAAGIDLKTLPVIMVKNATQGARSAQRLLASGAFTLIVVDTGLGGHIPTPLMSRLLGLVAKHASVLIFLVRNRAAGNITTADPIRTERLGERSIQNSRQSSRQNHPQNALIDLQQSPSISPLISLRAVSETKRVDYDHFVSTLSVIKDKRYGPGWSHQEHFRGPPGLH